MIKALFFDMDGTLVSFQTHRIKPDVFEALHNLKKNGYILIIATGRGKDGLDCLENFPFDGYITLNGQYCFDEKQHVLYQNTLTKPALKTLKKELEVDPFPCGFVLEEKKIFNFRDERVDAIHAITYNDDHPCGDISNIENEKVMQVMAFIDEEKERALLSKLPNCISARWHPYFCDISPLGGTKVKGMEIFAKHFGFSQEETMAFGDGGNDFAMLKHAHISVAMGNGDAKIKDIADYVCDNVDEKGILTALHHYTLL